MDKIVTISRITTVTHSNSNEFWNFEIFEQRQSQAHKEDWIVNIKKVIRWEWMKGWLEIP